MFWLSFKGLKLCFEKQKFRNRFGKCFEVVLHFVDAIWKPFLQNTLCSKNSLFTQTGICEASFESQIYMQCSSVSSVQILSTVNCFQLCSHMKKIFGKKIRKRKTQTKGLHLQRNSHLLKQFNSYMQTVPLSCTFSLT